MTRDDLAQYNKLDLELKAERIWEQVYAVAFVNEAQRIAEHPMNALGTMVSAAECYDSECGKAARLAADAAKEEFLEHFKKD